MGDGATLDHISLVMKNFFKIPNVETPGLFDRTLKN